METGTLAPSRYDVKVETSACHATFRSCQAYLWEFMSD